MTAARQRGAYDDAADTAQPHGFEALQLRFGQGRLFQGNGKHEGNPFIEGVGERPPHLSANLETAGTVRWRLVNHALAVSCVCAHVL